MISGDNCRSLRGRFEVEGFRSFELTLLEMGLVLSLSMSSHFVNVFKL
jgi:hypothetical protein